MRELQDRNKSLEAHILELQQAILDVLHGDISVMKPEHILHAELLELKRKNKVAACVDKSDTQFVESFGTLTISNGSDHTRWLGSTASSEFLLQAPPEPGRDFFSSRFDCSVQGIPAELLLMGRIFVFSGSMEESSANIRATLKASLPPKHVAHRLCDNFFSYGAWL
jgi:hypothetical protein